MLKKWILLIVRAVQHGQMIMGVAFLEVGKLRTIEEIKQVLIRRKVKF